MNYDGSVIIKTDLDNEPLEKELKKLDDSLGSLDDSFSKAEDSAISFADIIKGNLLSEVIIGGISGLAEGIQGIASNFIEAAASVKAETSQFEQTFGTLQGAAEEAIGRVAETSGVLETRLNTLGSQIYAFARSSDGDTAESMALMETALQASADSAAYYDRSLEDSTETLQSFLKGNYENDAALGLSATEVTRNAAAMKMFGAEFQELTEIQKQQTLLQMVLDAQALSGAMGQASREADGWENVQGNLNETIKQFQANVGAPALAAAVPIIQNITAGLQSWMENVDWEAFNANVGGFIDAVIENGPTIISLIASIGAGFVAWNVVTMIQGIVSAIGAFKTANEGLRLSQIAVNAVMSANPIGILVTLVAGLVAAIVTLWNTSEEFRTAWIGVWNGIENNAKNSVNGIIGFFEGMINSVIRGLNWLIEQMNKISFTVPSWVPAVGGKSVGINIPTIRDASIPRLAAGAVIPPNREFLAVLGDQKSGTNIEAPLATIKQAMLEAMRESGSMGGGGTIEVKLYLDGKQIAKNQIKHINNMTRMNGVPALLF